RHNFQGSFDALNYKDGYWQLRKESIGVIAGGQRLLPVEPADLARASEPTPAQAQGGMAELAYSSIMDYGARMNGSIHGIGKYDEAAILFGYSGGGELGWVEVFEETRTDLDAPHQAWKSTRTDQPVWLRGAHVQIPFAHVTHSTSYHPFYTDRFHYSMLPLHFADGTLAQRPLSEGIEQGIQRMGKRGYRKWSEMKPYYDAIRAELKSVGVNDAIVTYYDPVLPDRVVSKAAPAGMPVEVPYMFCTDSEVAANVTCNRWDAGADLYEMTRDWVSRYEDYYAFSHFKRDRLFFSTNSVLSRTYGRLLANLPNVYQNWLFGQYLYQETYGYSIDDMELLGAGDPVWQSYYTMGVFDGLNTLLKTFSAVPPGYYGKVDDAGGARWERLEENLPDSSRMEQGREDALVASVSGAGRPYTDVVYLPRGPGVRSPYTLTETDGYDFYSRVHEVGHFWDQVAAMNALTSSTTSFLGVDRGSDALKYSLPYFITFSKELSRAFSGVWTEDASALAPTLVKREGRLAEVAAPVQVRAEDYLAGFVYPPAPAPGAGPVERAVSRPTWGTRYYAELFGMSFFTENFNQDFATQNQVFILGSGDSVEPITGYKQVKYADRFGGGFSYAALCKLSIPTDVNSACVQPPAAATMVLRAEQLATQMDAETDAGKRAALEAELRETERSLDIMRGLYGVFGRVL
ncbi:MAG: hypothetical protein L0Y66_03955, partial [Myxococcaceae bacterium]|nr:hypothetical protein [Myxococcaceae bacterium]